MIRVGIDRVALHAAFDDILASGHLTEGKYVRKFEEAVSKWSGLHAVAVNSAGSGLFALFRQFDPGAMIVPTNTFYATGGMAREAGHSVVLADCSPFDFSMTVATASIAEGKMSKAGPDKLQAVVTTHVGGILPKSYEQLAAWCSSRDIPLIEDAAHSLGVKRDGLVPGSLGTAAVFSLYPTKSVPAGEGGVIVTRDADLADELRVFRNYGKEAIFEGSRFKSVIYSQGFNLRMDEWTAAVAWLQMERLPDLLAERHKVADQLRQIVPPLEGFDLQGTDTNWYKYVTDASFPAKRQAGKIYAASDQLTTALFPDRPLPALRNAALVAEKHICLPLNERQFMGWTTAEIEAWLMGED